jgi:hypothetical protein
MVFTVHYDQLPAGTNENGLYIALWNGTAWIQLASTIDPVSKTVSASVSHFSKYALIVPLVPNRGIIKIPANTTKNTAISTAAVLRWGLIVFIVVGFLVAMLLFILFLRKTKRDS